MPTFIVPVFVTVSAEDAEAAVDKVTTNIGRHRVVSAPFSQTRPPEVGPAVERAPQAVELSDDAKAALKAALGE
jgi:hypothetical protein